MFDILNAIYHEDPLSLSAVTCLENPQCEEERKIVNQLRAGGGTIEKALIPSIEALAEKKAEQSFYRGACFGAQLMARLLEEL